MSAKVSCSLFELLSYWLQKAIQLSYWRGFLQNTKALYLYEWTYRDAAILLFAFSVEFGSSELVASNSQMIRM